MGERGRSCREWREDEQRCLGCSSWECSLEEAEVWGGKKNETSGYGLNKRGTEWPPSESPCNSGEHRGAWESPLEGGSFLAGS